MLVRVLASAGPYLDDRDTPDMDDWREVGGALERTYELGSFEEAIAFLNRVAVLAEAENHHPDIAIAYRKVTLRWTTHSAGGITDRDRELARRSDELA
jgi:4a-hydroxytetrahydrobiopterin dehydratase